MNTRISMAADAPVDVRDLRREVLVVDNMFCASCAGAVEALLNRQPGVTAASVHFAADAAAIQWDARLTTIERIKASVANLGYPVRTLAEPADEATRRELKLGARLAVALFCGMWSMLAMAGLYFGAPGRQVAHGLALAAGAFALPALAWSGWPFYLAGWRTLRARAPGLDALILLGTVLAVLLSLISLATGRSAVYFDTALMLVGFQLIARIVDSRVRADAARRVRALLEPGEGSVRRISADGSDEAVAATDVKRDERLRLSVGDTLRLDGRLQAGTLSVDRARLTGEAATIEAGTGDLLWAGDRIVGGCGEMTVTAVVGRRRLDQLAGQVRRLLTEKPGWQRQVDRLARWLLPIATAAAVLGAMLVLINGGSAFDAAVRALAVFVIACPCALSLAIPLAATRTVSIAAAQGWLFRDVDAIQRFRLPDTVLLDKTGTLTEGRPEVVATRYGHDVDKAGLHRIAAIASRGAAHPLAQALARLDPSASATGELEELPGRGLIWRDASGETRIGSREWLTTWGFAIPAHDDARTSSDIVRNGQWIGRFSFDDRLCAEADTAIAALKALGIAARVVSGDREGVVTALAARLGIDGDAQQSPEAKLALVERLQAVGRRVVFCGDGVNDGPALAAADQGIAVSGATGAAQAAASISLLRGGVEQLPRIFVLLGTSRRVMRQNLAWALIWNAAALPLAIAGVVHPAIAAAAMSLSSLAVVLNTARLR